MAGLALDLKASETIKIHSPGGETIRIVGRRRTSSRSSVVVEAPHGWRIDRTPPPGRPGGGTAA